MTLTTPVFGLCIVSLWVSLQGMRVSRAGDHQTAIRLLTLSLVLAALAFLVSVLGLALAVSG